MKNARQVFKKFSSPLIIHSPLHWISLRQRSRQFLMRLSRNRCVLFCESPLLFTDEEIKPFYTLQTEQDFSNIKIMQTYLPAFRLEDREWIAQQRVRLLKEAIDRPLRGQFNSPIQWFYDPAAITVFRDQLNEVAVIYDCLDKPLEIKMTEGKPLEHSITKHQKLQLSGQGHPTLPPISTTK